MQNVMPLTPMVKKLIIGNVVVWVLEMLVDKLILGQPWFMANLGLLPQSIFDHFSLWQLLSYMFLHAYNPMHLLFNMLLLWWIGSELEQRWGGRLFLTYYLVCGIGAAVLYLLALFSYTLISHSALGWGNPVVGASGAIFGLLLAFGLIFGERVIAFMMLFPMKAKYFVMILGGIELANLLNNGLASDVANLAHLGGIVSGFLFLMVYTKIKQKKWRGQSGGKRGGGRGLRLVVNNDRQSDEKSGPKYWN